MTTPLRRSDPEPARTCRYGTVDNFDIDSYLDGANVLLGGGANVIMQLSNVPIGHGVAHSAVYSGRADLRPWKRLRTTVTYLAVALLGNEHDRQIFRTAVNGSHRMVRSEPGAEVRYNAFDPELQKWVAACLYFGIVDLRERLYGPDDRATREVFLQYAARLGTTLQMKPDMWFHTLEEFDEYWQDGLKRHVPDELVAGYLEDLVDLRNVPRLAVFAPLHRFIVTGLLPASMREGLDLTWTPRQERRHRRLLRGLGGVQRRLPAQARLFPYQLLLRDVRRRHRGGRPLV
ncbi:oxygenase MpaB family protein [Nocardia stercoris]|uniref:DUF2236 domain-containing protein n=1 Tax=Nocardia stercoris TaxID=2483361 RepID=A0A3M2L145_9NOCA|nr:oxygenase MpaB family protein [Nocardia stercoris]RMI31367.1 DUF2236 domain-containing protein [Nocardia stercoris]